MIPWLDIPMAQLLWALAIVSFAALVQGTIGMGFAIISVPTMSLINPALAPVPQLLLSFPLTALMALRERHAIAWRSILWILVGRVPGAFLGLLLLKAASAPTLDVIIGSIVVLAALILGTTFTVKRTPMTEVIAGMAAGISALVSSIGGPPMALLYRDEKGEVIRATLAAIFTLGLGLTISVRAAAHEVVGLDIKLAICLFPAMFLGLWSSRFLIGKVEGRPLRVGILSLCAFAGLALIARAVLAG